MARKVLNGLDLTSQKIINLASPSSSTDAANKAYVDAAVNGLQWKAPVQAAATTNINTASPGATFDGYTASNGDRILLGNQSTQSQNGIYTFNGSASAMTRTADANTAAQLYGAAVLVVLGSTNADKAYVQVTDPITLGTTNIVWNQFGGGQAYSAGNGLQLTSTTFSVLGNGTSLDISSSGVKISQNAAGNGISISTTGVVSVNNGSGLTFSGSSLVIDTSKVVQKFATSIGDGSTLSYTVTHNLGTLDVTTEIYDNSTLAEIDTDVVHATTNTITVTFAVAPTSNQYRVVVHG